MIRIPYCFTCENCKEGMRCAAYPDGIPKEVLHTKKVTGDVCKGVIGYKKKG